MAGDKELRARLVADIDAMLDRLSEPLPPVEATHGWSAGRVRTARDYLTELRAAIESGERLGRTLKRPSLARDFSDIGILRGELLDDLCKIGNQVWATDL